MSQNRRANCLIQVLLLTVVIAGCRDEAWITGDLTATDPLPAAPTVVALSTHYIQLNLTNAVAPAMEVRPSSYVIVAPGGSSLPVTAAELAVEGSYVLLTTKAQAAVEYDLTVVTGPDAGARMTFAGNTEPEPAVLSAASLSSTTVLVRFSEPMDSDTVECPMCYAIRDQDGDVLEVIGATSQPDGSGVILTTSTQAPIEYTLVVTAAVRSTAGRPVDPTGSAAMFLGVAPTFPHVVSARSTGNTTAEVTFDLPMSLGAEEPSHYSIVERGFDAGEGALEVVSAGFLGEGHTTVGLVTGVQREVIYTVSVVDVTDRDGRPMASPTDLTDPTAATFLGTPPVEVDTDGDGLTDAAELECLTDPTKADTDGDGLSDGVELGVNAGAADGGTGVGRCCTEGGESCAAAPTIPCFNDDECVAAGTFKACLPYPGSSNVCPQLVAGSGWPERLDPLNPDTDCDKFTDGDELASGLNPLDAGDTVTMCGLCHASHVRGLGEGGSHPTGFVYPGGEAEFPFADTVAPLELVDGRIVCITCHTGHGAAACGAGEVGEPGNQLRKAADETHCRACHTDHAKHHAEGVWQPTCTDCHDMHSPSDENTALIAREIGGTAVTFLGGSGGHFLPSHYIQSVAGPPTYDGLCETCHTTTAFHRNGPEGNHTHYADRPCKQCHLHGAGFRPEGAQCTVCHALPPQGIDAPDRAGSHQAHITAVSGPMISDCQTCHASQLADTHDNGAVSFMSGQDANADGHIDLAETDVCDACHGAGGPFDGVNEPIVGAKANWSTGVYDGPALRTDKSGWCLGCHDAGAAVVHGVEAPDVAGDGETWGYNVVAHGRSHVLCTDCHDPTVAHTDGVANTFSLRFPLAAGGTTPGDKEAYNDGYRLRRIDGELALEVPRVPDPYRADAFRLCFQCHDEVALLGVPSNYWQFPPVPPYLQMTEGVARTDHRNEQPWGLDGSDVPVNAHAFHIGMNVSFWDLDRDGNSTDSGPSCVMCHNPHGARKISGGSTFAMTRADLDISHGVYNDGVRDYEYGYIGSSAFAEAGGDLYCRTCHPYAGAGNDPPDTGPNNTRYYRDPLDLRPDECRQCHGDALPQRP